MPSVAEHLATCARHLGYHGSYNAFNRWYWCELHGYANDPGTAWCAAFQSYCAAEDGIPATPSASAAAFGTQFPRVSDESVRPGDIVVFNWDGRSSLSWADHVGIVEWSDINGTGYFGTIEGNVDNAVKRITRNNNASYFTAFFRPTYSTPLAPTRKETSEVKPVSNAGGEIYRVYNPNGGKHHFPATKAERDLLVAAGWNDEGVAWVAPRGGTIPVYMLYKPGNGDHLLTTSYGEAVNVEANDGYVYEGVPFFANVSGVAVYRVYNPYSGEHFYTADASERDQLVAAGRLDEDVAFYAVA